MFTFSKARLRFVPLCLLSSALLLRGQEPSRARVEIRPGGSAGWVRLSAQGQPDKVYTLQASTDLSQWKAVGLSHGGFIDYPDAGTPLFSNRFYRVFSANRTPADDWKNQVHYPDDPLLSTNLQSGQDFRWIKFAIDLNEPYRVYYQDSARYLFHFDFASARLDRFRNLTPTQFERVALHTNEQQILLGTLLVPPWPTEGEYGIQFVGQDAYPPELVSHYFELVKSTVVGQTNLSVFYVPVFEQARSTETNRSYFESKGIRLATAERWIYSDDIYSTGWALGRLKFFPGTEINTAFADGRLQPEDILLTDGVPAEIPVLAGVLTLWPSTPNSHVAILAKSFGLPFAYLADPGQRERVQQLVGKDILLRLDPDTLDIKVLELESSMDPALRAEILDLNSPPKLEIVAKAKYGQISARTDNLTPADIKFFGGKASNFGFLRRLIPERSPEAIAFSFDLWDAFLEQLLPNGRTLRAEIQDRLAGYAYPPNIAALKLDLAEIRSLITRTARFTPAQQQAILNALVAFGTNPNIRFRSSTNVEDSEQFTGAGLYDSFSGCPADDLDGDNVGPSHCDPTEDEERGVFRAIQKVYASFYNDNAFIERLRHRVDEDTVGMALLVHHSAPDETELANGVAALKMVRGPQREINSTDGELVTQKGAVSVTNPDGTAKPEVVQGYDNAFNTGGWLRQRSSLVPLGATVLEWQTDYIELMKLFARVGNGYYAHFPHKREFTLDFEYKKLVPGVLSVKQVREVPVIVSTNTATFLVHQTNQYWVLQGEAADVFSNHRLKSFWSFQARNMKLTGSNQLNGLYGWIEADLIEGKRTNHLADAPANLPNASHAVQGEYVIDRWTSGTGAERRDYELRTQIGTSGFPNRAPVLTLADFRLQLFVNYATPQPSIQWGVNGLEPSTVTQESVVLEPRRVLSNTNYLQQRKASAGTVKIDIAFYWPAPPSRGIADKTAPLAQWKSTRIEGLTTQPLDLRGEFSQTYRPGHHNFSEEFVFEPALEPGVPASVLGELAAANVQFIHVFVGFNDDTGIRIVGVDGRFRTLN